MSEIIRQSTQVVKRIGPFMDSTTGVTPEVGITLSAADQAEALKAAGAATVSLVGETWVAVTGSDGWYDLTLTAAITDTIGDLTIVVQDASVCLPVFVKFKVIEENIYDAMFVASATAFELDHLIAVADADDAVDSSIIAKLASTTSDWSTFVASTDSLQANVDGSITASVLVDDIWDEDATAHQTIGTFGKAIGDPGVSTSSIWSVLVALIDVTTLLNFTTISTLSSQTVFTLTAGSPDDDAYNGMVIVVKDATVTTQKAIGVVLDYVGSSKEVTLASDPGVFTMAIGDSVSILVVNPQILDLNSRIPTALAGGLMSSNVTAISTSTVAADNLKASATGIIVGAAVTGTLTVNTMTSDLTGYVDDELTRRTLIFTGGTADGQGTTITDYASNSGTVTYETIATAPANGDTFVIV